ncbi:hypothetical protein D3C71_2181410 [compost metagenome]
MGCERQIAALHFLMGYAVAFAVISILQLFVVEKKTGEAVKPKLPGQALVLTVLDGEGENKLQQSGM